MALTGPDALDDRERAAVELLMYRLADDEFVLADRYTDWQVRAPTLESDLSLSNIAQDELGHARLWYDILLTLGHTEPDLIWERDPASFTHVSFAALPFDEGDWADAVVRNYLYDTAEAERLAALTESSYAPIADRVPKIQREESYHVEHATRWMERLCADASARSRVQDALDRLFPYALAIFEPVDSSVEADIDELGLRTVSLDTQREKWVSVVAPFVESLGLSLPDDDIPMDAGRGGEHPEAWFELYEHITRAYRSLGRHDVRRIVKQENND